MTLHIPPSVLGQLDLSRAVREELAHPPTAHPSRVLEVALRPHLDDAVRFLTSTIRRGTNLRSLEELQVAKAGGIRPTLIMTFQQRVLFRALTIAIADALPTSEHEHAGYDDFKWKPLHDQSVAYIVSADVAAFFQYVDHDSVATEIVNHAADFDIAASIQQLLTGLAGRAFGLPQGFDPSRVLAEALIDRVQRRVIRRGFPVWRYNDDFRIGASSWPEGAQALELLEAECRSIGLTLNDAKSFIESREDYERYLAAPEAVWQALLTDVEVDLSQVDVMIQELYDVLMLTGEEDDRHDVEEEEEGNGLGPEWVTAALTALTIWLEGIGQTSDRIQERVRRRLAVEALKILRVSKSPTGLHFIPQLLRHEPHLTPLAARYLRNLYPVHREEVDALLTGLIVSDEDYLSPWKAVWLFEPMFQYHAQLNDLIAQWITGYARAGMPDIVRARASYLLTRAGLWGPEELAVLYDELREAALPDVVAALAASSSPSDPVRHSIPKDRISQWIVESVDAESA